MSGGHFDYQEWRIDDIADEIEQKIINSEEEFRENDYPTIKNGEVLKELKRGLKILRQAYIYAHRIDYLLSGTMGRNHS